MFVIKKVTNNAVTQQSLMVLIALVVEDPDSALFIDQHHEYDHALWGHSSVWHLFGDKHTSKSLKDNAPITTCKRG